MQRFLRGLATADVECVDAGAAFQAHRSEDLFLATDHHWSERGRRLAAAATAERLQRYGGDVLVVGDSFARNLDGDLVELLHRPCRKSWTQAGHSQWLTDLAREPELLDDVGVVVWVVARAYLPTLKPLPLE